ncbi:complexed with cef1p [Lithohypha guttulata]|uniref:Complexed with cef1p n=1 Tax=Lithohypha guttulata TaxID=1690604 RepID=A0AAN7STA2_9EURO|nr:complexed with cef1p [Lithohypha guttulata]
MTTAHRPTFDPARGKEAQRGPAYHQRLQAAHTQLKYRKAGQGGEAGFQERDLRAELLAAEAAHFSKKNGSSSTTPAVAGSKRAIEQATDSLDSDQVQEDEEAKRRRILEETREIDKDDSDEDDDSSEEDDDDEEDETAELMRELEKIKRERAEAKAKEEAEKAAKEQDQREEEIAYGNPLLNPKSFDLKRRWDDDVVFKNQARGTEQKTQKEFVNDLLRSDFHKKFMSKPLASKAAGNRFGYDRAQRRHCRIANDTLTPGYFNL